MRPGVAAAVLFFLLSAPNCAPAQWRWWPFRRPGGYDDNVRLRRSIDEAREQQRLLQKQDRTRATVQRPPAPIPRQAGADIQGRYVILTSRIERLKSARAEAVRRGAPPSEIAALDASLKQLRLQADALRAAPGLPP